MKKMLGRSKKSEAYIKRLNGVHSGLRAIMKFWGGLKGVQEKQSLMLASL